MCAVPPRLSLVRIVLQSTPAEVAMLGDWGPAEQYPVLRQDESQIWREVVDAKQ